MVFVTRSHKSPWRKPARELPCGKTWILLRNHYLFIFVCALNNTWKFHNFKFLMSFVLTKDYHFFIISKLLILLFKCILLHSHRPAHMPVVRLPVSWNVRGSSEKYEIEDFCFSGTVDCRLISYIHFIDVLFVYL